jgi:putative ABC transport system ATP-binding protein
MPAPEDFMSGRVNTNAVRIRATGLSKSYGSTVALVDAHVEILDGESVAIMGPSGSGKTTLLHILAGIVPPDAGEVLLRTATGTSDVAGLSDRERSTLRQVEFGFVFQQGLLIPELTAVENVALPLLLQRVARYEAQDRAEVLLDELGLHGLGSRRIGQLSGGQAQRVAIARARVTGARVIFGDEPTGALDSKTAYDVLTALLDSTVGQGRSLVVVTHDEAVAGRCSRTVRLRDGTVLDTAAGTGR